MVPTRQAWRDHVRSPRAVIGALLTRPVPGIEPQPAFLVPVALLLQFYGRAPPAPLGARLGMVSSG